MNNSCKIRGFKKGTSEYQCWLVDHQCEVSNEGSSGSMESVGAVAMLKKSLQKNQLYNNNIKEDVSPSPKFIRNILEMEIRLLLMITKQRI